MLTKWMRRLLMIVAILMAVISCAPRTEAGAPLVSLQVVDGDVRDVLLSLAKMADVNLVLDDSIEGKISARIDAKDVYAVLALIANMKGLEYDQSGDTILIGKKAAMHQNFGQLRVFALDFADPRKVVASAELALGESKAQPKRKKEPKEADAKSGDADDVSALGQSRFAVDEATNSLLFYGTAKEAEVIRALLDEIDKPYPQVLMEAKVIAINKDRVKDLGIEWEWSDAPQYPDRSVEYETVESTVTVDGKPIKVTENVPKETVSRKFKGTGNIPGIISFGRGPEGYPFEMYYSAKVNALIASGKANILAKPNIMTLNGNEAMINIGGDIPVPTVMATNVATTTSFEYRRAGIILKYTPRVNSDGCITVDVHTEVSSPDYVSEMKAYRFYTRSADTSVRLKDGQTMIIGGLIGSEESKAVRKIPFLGDLPVLGSFFKSVKNSKTESEVMIFLTAHIVK